MSVKIIRFKLLKIWPIGGGFWTACGLGLYFWNLTKTVQMIKDLFQNIPINLPVIKR